MSWSFEKSTGDIVINGFENGVAASPHEGIGLIQSANISTEAKEIMCSYNRTLTSQINYSGTGTISPVDASHVTLSGANIRAGTWITVTGSTITGLSNATYYVTGNANGFTSAQLATTYQGSPIAGLGATGTASFTVLRNMGLPVASATEIYGTTPSYRYYILDNQGLVWVYDTATADPTNALSWFLPDSSLLSSGTAASGIAVLNGYVFVFQGNNIWVKSTTLLGNSGAAPTGTVGWSAFSGGSLSSGSTKHFAFLGHQSTLNYTDGNFIGTIFPTSGAINIFSYWSFGTSGGGGGVNGTIGTKIGGTWPTTLVSGSAVPVTIWSVGGTKPTAITLGTIYYLRDFNTGTGTFSIYAAATGGAAIDINTGASGTLYFNTFNPIYAGSAASYVFTPQACTLPSFETAQALAEIGNLMLIGCGSNTIYQWNQVDPQASGFVALPENNIVNIITVNNMGYAFAGAKGNVYVTNGSTSSLAISVPDYAAGIVEPYFTWGDAMYLRGRVYFSIQDQFSGHTGQCGGIWSFVPVENYIVGGNNHGSALKIENQNSYGTYNGRASVLLPSQDQLARGPQFWAAWISNSVSSPTYGIDVADTYPNTNAVIQTDLIPTGTFLNKNTFKQIEYKLTATPDGTGDSVSMAYRTNLTDAFTSISNSNRNTEADLISGYWTVTFERGQWLQLQISLVPSGNTTTSSFVRLSEIRVR